VSATSVPRILKNIGCIWDESFKYKKSSRVILSEHYRIHEEIGKLINCFYSFLGLFGTLLLASPATPVP
jgi:hypothetical protein